MIDDATQLRGGFAENKFGENIVADTSEIAEYYDAVFAINGDYYGFRDSGIVIRNGVLYRDDGARTGLAIYTDGTMEVYDETTTTGEELLAAGVWNTLSFGPALLDDGRDRRRHRRGRGRHQLRQPLDPGRPAPHRHRRDRRRTTSCSSSSTAAAPATAEGVTMTEFAQIFQDLGATVAYNLDGGGSSTM